jgi:origin recognition complex subunit 3
LLSKHERSQKSLTNARYDDCIPTALITVGSNVSSLGRLLAKLNDQLTAEGEGGVVILESGDAPNLKTTLKNIIRAAVTNTEGNDGYQNFLTDREVTCLIIKLYNGKY